MRVAEVERDQLGNPVGAIAALSQILETAASDPGAVAAILNLFAAAGRWQELLNLGTRVGQGTQGELVALFVRLGDACRTQLSDPQGAATWYARALAVDPRTQGLRDALLALADNEVARASAVDGVVRCCTATDDWQGLLAILPHRLALAQSEGERVRIHREAAEIEEKRAQRPGDALGHHIEILKLRPDDTQAEAEILRLAAATGEYALAAKSIEQASTALPPAAPRLTQLLLAASRLFDENAGDKPAALACAEKAAKAAPADRAVRLVVVRLASQQGAFQTAVEAALAEPFDAGVLVGDFLLAGGGCWPERGDIDVGH
jgi:tetratricopeptide (TPR) repeat protein